MTDIREILRRLHRGEPDRRIARDLNVSRNTVAHYRLWAARHGVLRDGQVPEAAILAALLSAPRPSGRPMSTGVGKSHLAQALAHEACRRGHEVLFISTDKMLAHLAGGRADGTHEQRLARYTRPALLVLDDFGLKRLRAPGPEDLYDVVKERYERGSILLTSNRDRSEWPDLFGEALLASAALDRLTHGAHFVEITGHSFRAEHTKKQLTARRTAAVRARNQNNRHGGGPVTSPNWLTMGDPGWLSLGDR